MTAGNDRSREFGGSQELEEPDEVDLAVAESSFLTGMVGPARRRVAGVDQAQLIPKGFKKRDGIRAVHYQGRRINRELNMPTTERLENPHNAFATIL